MARAAKMQSKPIPTRKRAFQYARVSDKTQAEEDKASLPEQFAEMDALCAREGWEVVGREQDVGPGWSKHRAGFQRILKYCEEGSLRHHSVLEVGPPQQRHVSRRSTDGSGGSKQH